MIKNHLYGGATGKAKNLLSLWIGQLDAPTAELRAIEGLLALAEEQQKQLTKAQEEIERLKAIVKAAERYMTPHDPTCNKRLEHLLMQTLNNLKQHKEQDGK